MSNFKVIFLIFSVLAFLKLNVSEAKIHKCDFVNQEPENECAFDVKPGDSVEFICKYVERFDNNFEQFNLISDFNMKQFCFNYVNVVRSRSVKKIEDVALGVYGVSTVKNNEVTTSTITFPPFISKNVDFLCSCYTKGRNQNIVRRILTVQISQNSQHKSYGCNFNDHESVFPEFGKKSDYDQTKMCNLYNVLPEANLGILCPEGTTVEPEQCFTEVFTYERLKFREKKQLANEETEKVDITKLTNGKSFTNIAGDANNKYATIPSTVKEKFLFFCRCKNPDGGEEYRMNVYVNLTEGQAKAIEVEEKHTFGRHNFGKDSKDNSANRESGAENTEKSSDKKSDINSIYEEIEKSVGSSNHTYLSLFLMLFSTYILTFA